MSETTHRALRLALASLLAVALIARLAIGMSQADLTVADFFSSFTVLSNTMAVIVFGMLAWRPTRSSSRTFSMFRGAATVYMSVMGLVYAFFLAPTGIDIGPTEPWVHWSLHIVGPVALAIDWIVFPPEMELPQLAPVSWLAFPAAYLIYSLARGAIIDWYPYPSLNPQDTGGYAGVAMWSAVALLVTLGLGYAYHWWANRRVAAPAAA
jgi:hypothetical protein